MFYRQNASQLLADGASHSVPYADQNRLIHHLSNVTFTSSQLVEPRKLPSLSSSSRPSTAGGRDESPPAAR